MGKNLEILNKLTAGNKSTWLQEAKRRQRYGIWYDFVFFIKFKWIVLKHKLGWKKSK